MALSMDVPHVFVEPIKTSHERAAAPINNRCETEGRGLYGGGDEVDFLPNVNGKPARAGATSMKFT